MWRHFRTPCCKISFYGIYLLPKLGILLLTTSINLSPTSKCLKITRGRNAPTSKRTSKRLPTQRTNIQASLWESFQASIFQVLQMFVLPALIITRRGMPPAPTLPPCRRRLVSLLNPRSLWSYREVWLLRWVSITFTSHKDTATAGPSQPPSPQFHAIEGNYAWSSIRAPPTNGWKKE